MQFQKNISVLSTTCILALSACGGGGGSGVGGGSGGGIVPVEEFNGIPSALPLDQDMIVFHAAADDGEDPTVGASVIRVVDEDSIVVSFAGQVYELARTSGNEFETADGVSTLFLPIVEASGEHAGLMRLVTDNGAGTRQVSQLVGIPDALDALPDSGIATFSGRAHTYTTDSSGGTNFSDDWDVEVVANFQVQGVGVSMTNGTYTLEMDPAGIQNNGGTAVFQDTLTSSDNPLYAVGNGTMFGVFYGGGQEVGGRFSYDVTTPGDNSSVAGVFHAD